MKIEHIGITVTAPHTMAQWYADNLGFRIIRKSGDDVRGGVFVLDESGETILELFATEGADPFVSNPASPLTVHIAFESESFDSDIEKLKKAGAEFLEESTPPGAETRMALLKDPWGITLQLAKRKEKLL